MTREEAKRRLLDIERCTPIHTREDERNFEALEMAIQALSQEPCDTIARFHEDRLEYALQTITHKPCEDVISREAVLKAIDDDWICNAEQDYRGLVEEIKKMPSIKLTSNAENDVQRVESVKNTLQDRPIKTLQKPKECRNKNCVAMCSPAWAEFWFDKPDCPNYIRGEDRPIVT